MDTSEFDIIRDQRYTSVFQRDMRRQSVRRISKKIGVLYETAFKKPGWLAYGGRQKTEASPQLSTCIITMNAEHRIVPLLRYIRSFSDEIVVGVDRKTTDNTFAACEGLADELFWIENQALTCNGGLESLISRCHGDWILRLDDDEFPEPSFHEVLSGLIQPSAEATHYKLPRLHLSAVDPLTWIDDGYLYPDFQMRLFKNERSLLKFPGNVGHLGIECAGKRQRINTVNLVHLNLAINPRFKREEKLKIYIKRLNGGWVHPVNEQALLFEDFNLRQKPYCFPDQAFCQLLQETTRIQRNMYLNASSR
jgi:glycosyltransferase involved in cell wall biosynthesis